MGRGWMDVGMMIMEMMLLMALEKKTAIECILCITILLYNSKLSMEARRKAGNSNPIASRSSYRMQFLPIHTRKEKERLSHNSRGRSPSPTKAVPPILAPLRARLRKCIPDRTSSAPFPSTYSDKGR